MVSRRKVFAGVRNRTGARMKTWKAYLLDTWRSAVTGSHNVLVSTHFVSIIQLESSFSLSEEGCGQQEKSEQADRSRWLQSEIVTISPFSFQMTDIF
jgi:hypothetical protein